MSPILEVALHVLAAMRFDWNEIHRHVAQGRHSQIPECCIVFFVTDWLPWQKTHQHVSHPYEKVLREYRHLGIGYVPCPTCFARRSFASVHECTRECEGMPGASPMSALR